MAVLYAVFIWCTLYSLHMCARIDAASLAALARLGGIRVLAYVHRLLYRHSSLYRLHMCARIGAASIAALAWLEGGGIWVLAYVHRLLYKQSSGNRISCTKISKIKQKKLNFFAMKIL